MGPRGAAGEDAREDPVPVLNDPSLLRLGSAWEGGLPVPIHVIQAAFVDGHANTTVFPTSFSIHIDSFHSCLPAQSSRASPAEQGLWYLKNQFLRELQIGVPRSEGVGCWTIVSVPDLACR